MGTKHDLADKLTRGITPNTSRSDVLLAVKKYWDEPSNVNARRHPETAEEVANFAIGTMASFDDFLPEALKSASSDPLAWEALREHALSQVEAGKELHNDILRLLLRKEGKPKRPGRHGSAPGNWHRDLQLAYAVSAVHFGSEKLYTLSTNDTTTNNAFSVVAEATGQTFDIVSKSWKRNKGRFV